MKPWILVLALAFIPWAGCFGGGSYGIANHPELVELMAPERGSPMPVSVGDCAGLHTVISQRAEREAATAINGSIDNAYMPWRGGGGVMVMEDGPAMAGASSAASNSAAPPASPTSAGSAHDAQVTGTNNQEAGVDEGDLVKTDGEWTYVLYGTTLEILHSTDVGDVEPFHVMKFSTSAGSYGYANQGGTLLLERRNMGDAGDDRLVLVLSAQSPETSGKAISSMPIHSGSSFTRIITLGLADRANPTTLDDQWVEGSPQGARLVAGTAYVVVYQEGQPIPLRTDAQPRADELEARGLEMQDYYNMAPDAQREIRADIAKLALAQNHATLEATPVGDEVPSILHATRGSLVAQPLADDACSNVLAAPGSTGRGFSTILSLSVGDDRIESKTIQVMGSAPIVYAAQDALVLASASQDTWWYQDQPDLQLATDLQWFTLAGLDVTPTASGRAPGLVEDSFGMDVHDGELRVVTATGLYNRGLVRSGSLVTTITVFDPLLGQLVPHGIVSGIAPGEHLWSVRFTDERAYIVTFREMDPLWVVDLTSSQPQILGELKVAGVSTYIHPIGNDRLLTIGYGGGELGQGLDESKILVSLFDVANPSDPHQLAVLDLSPNDGGVWTGALHEHKAFTYWDDIGTLAVPVNSYGYARDGAGQSMVGLELVNVDTAGGRLTLRGVVDQNALASNPGYGTEVERSYFLGTPGQAVSVYAISPLGVTANDLYTLEPQGHVAFAKA
jgi:hypothetical protein